MTLHLECIEISSVFPNMQCIKLGRGGGACLKTKKKSHPIKELIMEEEEKACPEVEKALFLANGVSL